MSALLSPASRPEAAAYRAAARSVDGIEAMLLPVDAGIELSCKRAWPG